ncbi:MAG: OsmC family protein [Bacteroidia bacterium]|nr:OsmC family protein [Bacteroidia bacterium]
MKRNHRFTVNTEWTGNLGPGTSSYSGYERSHTIRIENKPELYGSSDSSFRGDPSKHNPEELLLAALSSCHMLWYLHLCSEAGIQVMEYRDIAHGILTENIQGSGKFTGATLNPEVIVSDASMVLPALDLHAKANAMCFIANSVNFPIDHHPTCTHQHART